jgi:multimeric flavodoxin WrbA
VNDETDHTARVVAVLGSPRRKGNCAVVLGAALDEIERRGADVETIHLSAHDVRYCAGHDDCAEREKCPVRDEAAELLERVFAADAVIFASPVYADNVSGQLKVFIDRGCHPYVRGGRLAARAVGLVTVADSTGLQDALAAMRRALFYFEKGSAPVPVFEVSGYASSLGEAAQNEPLLAQAREMGRRIAQALEA